MKTFTDFSMSLMLFIGRSLAVFLGWIVFLMLNLQVLSCFGKRSEKCAKVPKVR